MRHGDIVARGEIDWQADKHEQASKQASKQASRQAGRQAGGSLIYRNETRRRDDPVKGSSWYLLLSLRVSVMKETS
ncbi:hypothetical protein M0802_000370 [Mischocyttarus mexicanus]|nr:hypothetical protein M0802_000370 [Mischocyttarus mexicanus]